jgi:hypothetical protein
VAILRENITKFLSFEFNFIANNLALKKPWLYLSLTCYGVMWLLVWLGNPLLPIPILANYGWCWHHIPEITSSVFFGIWVGTFGFLSDEAFSIRDGIPLLIIIALTTLAPSRYYEIFWLILIVVSTPSFMSYVFKRIYRIHKSRKRDLPSNMEAI